MEVVAAAMKTSTISLVNFLLAAMPLVLFFCLFMIDLLQILMPYGYLASWGLFLHAGAISFSFVFSLPKIFRYLGTLPSYNKKKSKVTMTFQEVLCTVAVSIFAVTFLFRWASVLPINFLVWPEGIALLIMLVANKRRFEFTARLLGKAVRQSFNNSAVAFIEPRHNEAT